MLRIDVALHTNCPFANRFTDLHKCFDRVLHDIAISIAIQMGFPLIIAKAYASFIDNFTVFNKYPLVLGKPRRIPISLFHGFPFSRRTIAGSTLPWMKLIRSASITPRALTDDLATWAQGTKHVGQTAWALLATHRFLNVAGTAIQTHKTWALASSVNARKFLGGVWFVEPNKPALSIKHDARDLGGNFDYTMRGTGATNHRRSHTTSTQCTTNSGMPSTLRGRFGVIMIKHFCQWDYMDHPPRQSLAMRSEGSRRLPPQCWKVRDRGHSTTRDLSP